MTILGRRGTRRLARRGTRRGSGAGRRPPEAEGSFLLGSARALQRDQLETYRRAMRQHGDVVRFRLGPPRFGLTFDTVFSPEGARRILATDSSRYEKGAPIFTEFRHLLGDGLITSNGERWRRHRRIVAPLFTRQRLAAHQPVITEAAGDLVRWCEAATGADAEAGARATTESDSESRSGSGSGSGSGSADGGLVDMTEMSMRYALHVLGSALFGADIDTAGPVLRDALPALNAYAARRGLAPFRTPHWWPSPTNRRAAELRQTLWDLVDGLIDKRATALDGGPTVRVDLLQLLLEAQDPESGQRLSHDDVRSEVLLFLVAGHETTGSALAFTMWLLARHPDIQDRVRAEVAEAEIAGGDQSLSPALLPFISDVVLESLRLYPPAHTVVRQATADSEVEGHPVCPGDIVAVSIWGIHHRDDLWPEPERFRPDRHEERRRQGDQAPGGRYAHLAFGGGPRSCIGELLGRDELILAVAALVSRFRLTTEIEQVPTEAAVSLGPGGPIPVRLTPVGGSDR